MYISGWGILLIVLFVAWLIWGTWRSVKRERVMIRSYLALSDWSIGGFRQLREEYREQMLQGGPDAFVDIGSTIDRAVTQWDEITTRHLRKMFKAGMARPDAADTTEVVAERVENGWWWDADNQPLRSR